LNYSVIGTCTFDASKTSSRVHASWRVETRSISRVTNVRLAWPGSSSTSFSYSSKKVKTLGQKHYVDSIRQNTLVFGIGPAGTGKTYLAMACAIEALLTGATRRIVLSRPAVEAGERLGFLPGDLAAKVDPYLRPLYDALYEMLGPEETARLMEQGTIEIAPLAYMRGRTLNDAFVVLDEAQNTTPEQMKMFLTRLGFNSKMIITGDVTQMDLGNGMPSGLKVVRGVLHRVDGVGFIELTGDDVVRHRIVAAIVDAYARHEARVKAER
jgi:phosphate starvation-inducible PhoH-like protein